VRESEVGKQEVTKNEERMKLRQDVPTLGSMLLSSPDPDRLERWYSQFASFGKVGVLFDKRDDITGPTKEPTRFIMNFDTNDAKGAVAKLDEMGVEWVSPLEERDNGMFFATTKDPDGNYVQIIQSSDAMFIEWDKPAAPFPGYSVNDMDAARAFYKDVLGLRVIDYPMGLINLQFSGGSNVMIYPKDDHQPATFTVLNFPVDDVEEEVDALIALGVTFERYDGFDQDEKGISRSSEGPIVAWFKDPAGNILSLIQN
jgi:predicted enzyme related to lactoylglutathione lyase